MADGDALRCKWDARHRDGGGPLHPAAVLADNAHLLPQRGAGLDLACGLGANALYLAERGLEVVAWDLSPVAIGRLRSEARKRRVKLTAEVRDLSVRPPEPNRFDVIVLAHFLDRSLIPAIDRSLRPGGLLFYQTFAGEQIEGRGPSNPVYRLGCNELLRLFSGLTVRFYREEGPRGNPAMRDLAMLVAQRPA